MWHKNWISIRRTTNITIMKRIHIISGLIAAQFFVVGQSNTTTPPNETHAFEPVENADLPFKVGEKLEYNIRYGLIKAGEATLQVQKYTRRRGSSVYHMVGTGRTTGVTDWVFPTRDRYETYLDTSSLYPVEFIRDVDEDGYIIKRHILFDQDEKTARDLERDDDSVFSFENNMQDIFSAFYFARSMNVEGIEYGDIIGIDVFLDHEHFPFKLKFMGTQTVELDDFSINCMKFMPVVQEGRVFKDEETMTIWVSNDKNRIPVRLESELRVGSVKVDLTSYQNLAHRLNRR